GVRDAPRRARRAASAGLHRRQDDLALRRGGDRRSPRDAEGGWRLGGARQRGRAEAGQGGHRRGLGPLPRQPIGGWYGLKKGLRGRFGMYLPPLLEALGKVEVEHNPRNNRMRAL